VQGSTFNTRTTEHFPEEAFTRLATTHVEEVAIGGEEVLQLVSVFSCTFLARLPDFSIFNQNNNKVLWGVTYRCQISMSLVVAHSEFLGVLPLRVNIFVHVNGLGKFINRSPVNRYRKLSFGGSRVVSQNLSEQVIVKLYVSIHTIDRDGVR